MAFGVDWFDVEDEESLLFCGGGVVEECLLSGVVFPSASSVLKPFNIISVNASAANVGLSMLVSAVVQLLLLRRELALLLETEVSLEREGMEKVSLVGAGVKPVPSYPSSMLLFLLVVDVVAPVLLVVLDLRAFAPYVVEEGK